MRKTQTNEKPASKIEVERRRDAVVERKQQALMATNGTVNMMITDKLHRIFVCASIFSANFDFIFAPMMKGNGQAKTINKYSDYLFRTLVLT